MHIMRAPDQHAQGESIALLTTSSGAHFVCPSYFNHLNSFHSFLLLQMHIMRARDQHAQGECIALLTTAPEHTVPKLTSVS